MINGQRARIACSLILTAAATVASLGVLAPAQAAVPGWRLVSMLHQGPAADVNGLSGLAAPGASDAWAFGGSDIAVEQGGAPIAEHWNGSSWRAVALPSGLAGALGAASAPSGTDIWVVSQLNGYVLYYNGVTWSVAHTFPEGQLPEQLTGVLAFSPANVWVFGGSGAFPGVGTWHVQGHTWTKVTGVGAALDTASALSPRSIWAVGGNNIAPDDLVASYNGSTWTQAKSPALSNVTFGDVVALSSSSVWVSGSIQSGSRSVPCVVHYDGSTWTRYGVPWALDLGRMAPDGSGGFWVTALDPATGTWYALHRSAGGTWQRDLISSNGQVFGLRLIPGGASAWAAGTVPDAAGGNGAIWAYGPVG